MNIAPARRITGWMSEQELSWLAESASKSKCIVEAGSYQGRSTRVLCDNTDGIVHAVDPWAGNYGKNINTSQIPFADDAVGTNIIYSEFVINLSEHILKRKCIVHRKQFTDCFVDNPDMVFIDAIHDYEDCHKDIMHARLLMNNGGLLCGHDYSEEWPGVMLAVAEHFPERKINSVDTIWWTIL